MTGTGLVDEMIRVYEERQRMTPSRGYNVVILNDYNPKKHGSRLSLVKHTDSYEQAAKFKQEYHKLVVDIPEDNIMIYPEKRKAERAMPEFNDCHDADSGKFCSDPSGGGTETPISTRIVVGNKTTQNDNDIRTNQQSIVKRLDEITIQKDKAVADFQTLRQKITSLNEKIVPLEDKLSAGTITNNERMQLDFLKERRADASVEMRDLDPRPQYLGDFWKRTNQMEETLQFRLQNEVQHDAGKGIHVYAPAGVDDRTLLAAVQELRGTTLTVERDLHVELHPETNTEQFIVGEQVFAGKGGHWSKGENTIVIYDTNTEYARNTTIPHEFAHARWDDSKNYEAKSRFSVAVNKFPQETGITTYLDSYVKADSISKFTETYAALAQLEKSDPAKLDGFETTYPDLMKAYHDLRGGGQ